MDISEKIIKDLKERLEEEIAVKNGEVIINKELKILIEKLELQIKLLNEINERLYGEIAELRLKIKNNL